MTVLSRGAQAPGAARPLKALVTNESNLAVPDRFIVGVDAINNAGDWVTAAGGASSQLAVTGGWIGAAGGGSALILRRAGDATPTRLLQSGDPVPGLPLSAVNLVGAPRINQSGVVCALVSVYRKTNENAIVTHDGSQLRKVVASSDFAPASSGSVFGSAISLAGINDSGDVAFTAQMPGPPTGSVYTTVFIAPADGAIVRIVGPGDPAPGTADGTLNQVTGVQFNNRGEVLFRAAVVGGTGGFGYFVAARDGGSGVSIRKVVATGDANPGGWTFDAALGMSGVQFNDAGQVAFGNGYQLFISTPGTALTLVAARNTPMPAAAALPLQGRLVSWITALGASSFNDSGQVAFLVTLTGSSQNNGAVLRYTPGSDLEVVAYRGQVAPVTPWAAFAAPLFVKLNSAGDVNFYSSLDPGTPATGGQFTKPDGRDLVSVVLDGQPAPPSLGGTYRYTAYSHLLDDGSVYFETDLLGSPAAGTAALLATSSHVRVLVSDGHPLPSGSRVVFRNLFMGGAGSYTMFSARRSGGGNSLWTHNVATGVTSRVVAEGDPVPVPGGGLLEGVSTTNHLVTRTGDVVFPGTVRGTFGTHLFSWSPTGGLSRMVEPGDTLPGTTAAFTSCWFAGLLVAPFNEDTVVFRGNLNNGGNGIFLVPRDGGPVVKVVLNTDGAPGGGTFTSGSSTTLNYAYINRQGQVAFWGLTSTGTSGVFIGTAGSPPVEVAATGDTAPGGGTFSAFPLAGPAGFNDLGQVIFFATVTGGTGGGFFAGTADGPVQAIALNGTAAPAGGTYAFTATSKDARTNARGDILFQAPLADGTAGSGLFLRHAGTGAIETVALEGQPAPGTSLLFAPISVTINNYPGENLALGPTGEVLFTTAVDAGYGLVSGAFRYHGPGTLERVVMRGGPRPDGEAGAVVAVSQGPGAGGEGLFFLRVASVNGDFRDGIYLLDTMPPTLSVSGYPTALWPANGKFRSVTISGLAADNANGIAGTEGTFDVVDEYGLVQPAGTFTVGGSGTFSFGVPLEARRLGTDKDGRRYLVRVTVHDGSGNATTASATIIVPHSQGK